MGLEADCRARYKGKSVRGKAHLDTDELVFRGDFRLVIPLKDVKSAEARRGWLRLKFASGAAAFEVGSAAEKWALKIRYPRSRIDKLGVKPGSRVAVIGMVDVLFRRELAARTKDIAPGKPKPETDIIFLGVEDRAGLASLARWGKSLKRNGALWVVYPKGQKHITQADVMAAAKQAGLVDVKIVAFSETYSALKLVIPLARR